MSKKNSEPNQSAFIQKLYSMLEDPDIQNLISWDISGSFFYVHEPVGFSKIVLPQYFKHNNFASFVRQLNMYGFNKLNAGQQNQSNGVIITTDVWEFKHPDFRRGASHSLQLIKRKPTKTSSSNNLGFVNVESDVTKDEKINYLSHKITELEEKLEKLHESHNLLWSETVACRVLQSKHHQIVGNAVSFLASIYKEEGEHDPRSKKRKMDVDVLEAEMQKLSDRNLTGFNNMKGEGGVFEDSEINLRTSGISSNEDEFGRYSQEESYGDHLYALERN